MSTMKMSAYQKSRVRRMDLNTGDVSLIAARLDERGRQLPAQVRDVDVDHVGERVVVLVVEMVVDHRARHELAAVQREELRERVLLRGELDPFAAALDDAGRGVELEVSELQPG